MNDFENTLYRLISSSGEMDYIKKLVSDYLNVDDTINNLRNTINSNIEKIREQREIFSAVGQLDYVKSAADKEITRLVNEQKNLNDRIVEEKINNQKVYGSIRKFYSEFKKAIFNRTELNDRFVRNRKENEKLNSQLKLAMEEYNEFFKDLDEFASMGVGFNSIPEVARVIELKKKIADNDEEYKHLTDMNVQQLEFLNNLNNMSLNDFIKFVNLNMINNVIYLDDEGNLDETVVQEQPVDNIASVESNNKNSNLTPINFNIDNNSDVVNNDLVNSESLNGATSAVDDNPESTSEEQPVSDEDDSVTSDESDNSDTSDDDNIDEEEENLDEENEVNDYGEEMTPDPESFERESGFKAFISRNKKRIIAGALAVAVTVGGILTYKGFASHFKNKANQDNVSDLLDEENKNEVVTDSSSDIEEQKITVDGQDYTLGFNVNNRLHDEPRRVVTPSLEDTNRVNSNNTNSTSDTTSNDITKTTSNEKSVVNDITIGSKVNVEDGNSIYSNIYDAYYNQNAKVPYFGAGERTVIGVSLVDKDGNIKTVYASDENYNDLIDYYKNSGYDIAGYLTSNRNVDVNNMDLTSICQNAEGFYSADSFAQGRSMNR